jgi:hypothetical protein
MMDALDLFSTDVNNWNFNDTIIKPGIDPCNNNKKLDHLGYNLFKYDNVKRNLKKY